MVSFDDGEERGGTGDKRRSQRIRKSVAVTIGCGISDFPHSYFNVVLCTKVTADIVLLSVCVDKMS